LYGRLQRNQITVLLPTLTGHAVTGEKPLEVEFTAAKPARQGDRMLYVKNRLKK
jgi:hypothetical protein